MVVLVCKKLPQFNFRKYSFIIREMNEPVIAFPGKTIAFLQCFIKLYMLKLIDISGNILIIMVNSCCYGRCYVKKLIPLCTFLKFHTHLEENLARSFQNVLDKCSRVLNLVFSRN